MAGDLRLACATRTASTACSAKATDAAGNVGQSAPHTVVIRTEGRPDRMPRGGRTCPVRCLDRGDRATRPARRMRHAAISETPTNHHRPPSRSHMRISVIGCGYLGAVHAAAMAELGHEVVGIDVDPGKIAELARRPCAVLRAGPARDPRLGERDRSAALQHRHRGCRGARPCTSSRSARRSRATVHAADLRYVDAAIDGAAAAPARRRPRGRQEHRAGRHGRADSPTRRRARDAARRSPGTPSSCARATP